MALENGPASCHYLLEIKRDPFLDTPKVVQSMQKFDLGISGLDQSQLIVALDQIGRYRIRQV